MRSESILIEALVRTAHRVGRAGLVVGTSGNVLEVLPGQDVHPAGVACPTPPFPSSESALTVKAPMPNSSGVSPKANPRIWLMNSTGVSGISP